MSTYVAEADPAKVTTNIETFLKALKPADVLLFDKMNLWNGLVQWGDRAPVGHAALYLGKGVIVEASQSEPAVKKTDLKALLTTWDVRTVTALRHRRVTADDQATAAVLAVAQRYVGLNKRSEFAMTHLVALAPHALYRAYMTEAVTDAHVEKAPATVPSLAGEVTGRVLKSRWVRALLRTSRRGRPAAGPSTRTLSAQPDLQFTCSELVYRCFAEAEHPPGKEGELALDVVPLTVLSAGRSERPGTSRPGWGSGRLSPATGLRAPDAPGLDDVDDEVSERLEPPSPAEQFWGGEQFAPMRYGGPPTRDASTNAATFEQEAESGLLEGLKEYERRVKAAEAAAIEAAAKAAEDASAEDESADADDLVTDRAPSSADAAPEVDAELSGRMPSLLSDDGPPRRQPKKVLPLSSGGVHVDDVTPGDLWRSLSLDPVHVLHKPPERPA